MNFTIPIGKSSNATLHVFDAANADITSTGTLSASSDNPTAVTVAPGGLPNVFGISCKAAGTAHITYTFVNPSGTFTATDVVNPPDPPASMTSSYSLPA